MCGKNSASMFAEVFVGSSRSEMTSAWRLAVLYISLDSCAISRDKAYDRLGAGMDWSP